MLRQGQRASERGVRAGKEQRGERRDGENAQQRPLATMPPILTDQTANTTNHCTLTRCRLGIPLTAASITVQNGTRGGEWQPNPVDSREWPLSTQVRPLPVSIARLKRREESSGLSVQPVPTSPTRGSRQAAEWRRPSFPSSTELGKFHLIHQHGHRSQLKEYDAPRT